MDSAESDVDYIGKSELSESGSLLEVEVDSEIDGDSPEHYDNNSDYDDSAPYSEEPIADDSWIEEYEKEKQQIAKQEEMLQNRLNDNEPVNKWCKCGKCATNVLHNISECYCCKELEGCVEALESDMVMQDLPDDTTLNCITSHPGFAAVCLQKWSLRLAADKYRTNERKSYRQTGSEERFLHSISYREFSRLVYGFLGKKRRITLPACAYNSIRTAFHLSDDEGFSGFEMDLDNQ